MKWREGRQYNVSYVVFRISRELGVPEETVREILEEELDLDFGAEISWEDAAYLSEVIAAVSREPGEKPEPREQPEDLLSRQEAAKLLKISVNKLDGERRAGNLAYIQYGSRIWITRKAVQDYRSKNTHTVRPAGSIRNTYRKQRARRA